MLNRMNQLGLSLAVLAFAGLGTAQAQDGNPCGDMENPCEDTDNDHMDNPCSDTNPCDDADTNKGDDGDESATTTDNTAGSTSHSMVAAKGKIVINAAIGVGLAKDFVGDPISLSPDIIYGAADKLDVGLYHSFKGLTGFWSQSVGSLCLTGDFCRDEIYNGPTGLLANYSLVEGDLSVAANGGVIFSNIAGDTMLMEIKASARIQYAIGEKMGIQIDPAVLISLNERERNSDDILVPVAFLYSVAPQISAGVQTGITGKIDGFGDKHSIPLNLAGMYEVDSKLSVGGAFGFPNIAGTDSTADVRSLAIFAKYEI